MFLINNFRIYILISYITQISCITKQEKYVFIYEVLGLVSIPFVNYHLVATSVTVAKYSQNYQRLSQTSFKIAFTEALHLSTETLHVFVTMFTNCAHSTIPSQRFLMDDLKSFVKYPSKTTVGFAPKFTSNRKFFANMISSRAFKDMLARDVEDVRKHFIRKLLYCDSVIMDEKIVRDLYDRDVDQAKL